VIGLLWFVLAILVSPFRSKARLEAEIATRRQQLIVLQRKSPGRVRLTHGDRLLFVQLYRWFLGPLTKTRLYIDRFSLSVA
jgi:hypothetical protein